MQRTMNGMERRLMQLERMALESKEHGLEMFMDTIDMNACFGISYDRKAKGFLLGFYTADDNGKMYRVFGEGPYDKADWAAWKAYRLYLITKDRIEKERKQQAYC